VSSQDLAGIFAGPPELYSCRAVLETVRRLQIK